MARILLALLVLLTMNVLGPGPLGQNPQSTNAPATGLLMGVVVDPLDGRAVPDAQVTLGGAPAAANPSEVLTDADGRFVFMGLPKGSYTITATRPGYAQGGYGRRRPGGALQTIALTNSDRIADLKVPIWKHGVLTGRIVDEAGEPLIGIFVAALQRTIVAGKRKFAPGGTARTDDRGTYRLASLTPGDYVVVVPSTQTTAPISVVDLFRTLRSSAPKPGESDFRRDVSFSGLEITLGLFDRGDGRFGSLTYFSAGGGVRSPTAPQPSADGRLHVYPTQDFPAASTAAEATVTSVASGEERSGVNLQLRPVATSRISGVVSSPNGPEVAALSLTIDSDDLSNDDGFEAATTVSDATGAFTFLGVPPGRYRLRALWMRVPVSGGSRGVALPTPKPTASPTPLPTLGGFTLWGTQSVTVGSADINELAVTMRFGFRLSGRAEFVGSAPQPEPDQIRRMYATVDPADGRPFVSSSVVGRGQFDDKGQLSTYQLPPLRYYLHIENPPPGWTLKSATVGGRDITNVPIALERDVTGLVIAFTDRPASLSGQVNTPQSQPDSSATVLMFPADTNAWTDTGGFPRRLRSIRADRDGRYSTTGLSPGEYLVLAIADESSAQWQDPAVLQSLAQVATRITIGPGESRTLALTTSAVKR